MLSLPKRAWAALMCSLGPGLAGSLDVLRAVLGAAVGLDEVRGVVAHLERYGWLGREDALKRHLAVFLWGHPHRLPELGG
jgi:hypothetical protein